MPTPTVGKKVSAFSAVTTSAAKLTSKDLAGAPYVLYFYPKDDTPGCTLEGKDFRDHHDRFKQLKVRVLDVSGPIPADLIVASPKLPADIRFALSNAFLRIAEDRASKEIMTELIGADGFAPFTPAILREMKTLVQAARDASAVG